MALLNLCCQWSSFVLSPTSSTSG